VQAEKFVENHARLKHIDPKKARREISIFGQESNPTTLKLAKMNLAIRGIEAKLGETAADTFRKDLHPDLRADFILANPPFNMSYWGAEHLQNDVRWKDFPMPPATNANMAWVLHILHHLTANGTAGFVLANGSMSSNTGGEGDIRRKIIEKDFVDCMIALPSQLFFGTQIPACLWFLTRGKAGANGFRNRQGETLFIDARGMGRMESRTLRVLDDADILRIAGTYHAWRGQTEYGEYADIAGFCRSATQDDMAAHNGVLTPGRYVGAEEAEDDGEPFAEKFARLTAQLAEQFAESARLEAAVVENLRSVDIGTA